MKKSNFTKAIAIIIIGLSCGLYFFTTITFNTISDFSIVNPLSVKQKTSKNIKLNKQKIEVLNTTIKKTK